MVILVIGASALAITLLVVLNILIGGWSTARLRTPEEAAAALREGVFGFEAASPVGLDAEGRGALAREAGGDRVGLAVVFGDRVTVRALRPGEVRAVSRDGARLTIRLHDYTLPSATLHLSDAQAAQAWQTDLNRLAALVSDAPGGLTHA